MRILMVAAVSLVATSLSAQSKEPQPADTAQIRAVAIAFSLPEKVRTITVRLDPKALP